MENKKLLNGSLDKNVAMGLSWIPFIGWIFALIVFIVDFKTLDVEEKRTLVSVFVCTLVGGILGITFIVPVVVAIFSIIACIKAFMGQTFNVPGAYHLAAAIIK